MGDDHRIVERSGRAPLPVITCDIFSSDCCCADCLVSVPSKACHIATFSAEDPAREVEVDTWRLGRKELISQIANRNASLLCFSYDTFNLCIGTYFLFFLILSVLKALKAWFWLKYWFLPPNIVVSSTVSGLAALLILSRPAPATVDTGYKERLLAGLS